MLPRNDLSLEIGIDELLRLRRDDGRDSRKVSLSPLGLGTLGLGTLNLVLRTVETACNDETASVLEVANDMLSLVAHTSGGGFGWLFRKDLRSGIVPLPVTIG